ncbi:alanine racemase C-terminal domain-containing protein [Microbacterium pumilum]|uniref:Alanine racemase C-terminal domain-containing protein n=1 Tax=Microbacterium pumilum TaxID=344165 RepID=A0ABN2SMJ1_9MICO
MTAADLDASASAGSTRSAPVAQISHAALRENVKVLALPEGTLVGMPADAYGHGFTEVAGTLAAAGLAVADADVGSPHAEALLGLADGFHPVMRLSGRVLSVKVLRAGEGVSYGYTHRAERDTHVALVVGGYAQGIVRALGNRVSVSIAGERHPIVGRVAMDVCVVDIGETPVRRRDEVVFFGGSDGGEPSIEEWVAVTGLTSGELVTAVGLRAVREHRP